jgi:hypothetical protein
MDHDLEFELTDETAEQEEVLESQDRVDDIRLKLDKKGHIVATANQGANYQHRGRDLGDDNVWDSVARVEKRNHAASHARRTSRRAHGRAAECQPGSSLRGLSTKASSIGYPHCDACTCTFDPALYFVHPVHPSLLPHGRAGV